MRARRATKDIIHDVVTKLQQAGRYLSQLTEKLIEVYYLQQRC